MPLRMCSPYRWKTRRRLRGILRRTNLVTLSDNTIVEAQGGVVLQRGNDILKADFARYYSATNWVYLKGNVFVRMGKDDHPFR